MLSDILKKGEAESNKSLKNIDKTLTKLLKLEEKEFQAAEKERRRIAQKEKREAADKKTLAKAMQVEKMKEEKDKKKDGGLLGGIIKNLTAFGALFAKGSALMKGLGAFAGIFSIGGALLKGLGAFVNIFKVGGGLIKGLTAFAKLFKAGGALASLGGALTLFAPAVGGGLALKGLQEFAKWATGVGKSGFKEKTAIGTKAQYGMGDVLAERIQLAQAAEKRKYKNRSGNGMKHSFYMADNESNDLLTGMGINSPVERSKRRSQYLKLLRAMAVEEEQEIKDYKKSNTTYSGGNSRGFGRTATKNYTEKDIEKIEEKFEARRQQLLKRYEEEFGTLGNKDLQRRQTGGPITVPGTGSGDKVPMALPAGSFVLNRNASNFLRRQTGGEVPTMLEPGELVYLNDQIPRHGKPAKESFQVKDGASTEGQLERRQEGGKVNGSFGSPGKIFLHWTAGGGNFKQKGSYHSIVQGDGSIFHAHPYSQRSGVSHTYGRNSSGVGLSVAAMSGSPGNYKWPTGGQIDSLAKEVANIAKGWGMSASDITVNNVMTHAEAAALKDGESPHDNYGPKAWGGTGERWDLWHLTEDGAPGSGGEIIRNKVRGYMGGGADTSVTASSGGSSGGGSGGGSSLMSGLTTGAGATLGALAGATGFNPLSAFGINANPMIMGALLGASGGAALAEAFGFGGGGSKGGGGGSTPGASGPNASAILKAIADAEGTSKYPNSGYNTMFTGKQFSGNKHPRQKQTSGSYSSDAAGRYQFLSTTWDEMGMSDFSPANQDKAALKLLTQAGVNLSDGLSLNETYKVGQKWASVEGGRNAVKGGSYSGQAKYSAEQFMKMYKGYGGKIQGLQRGGMVNTLLEPGEMVFPNTTPGLQSLNSAVPRFQSGGMVDNSAIMEDIGVVPQVIVMPTPGGGGSQQAPQIANTGGPPKLSDGPSMASLNDIINRVSWSNVF